MSRYTLILCGTVVRNTLCSSNRMCIIEATSISYHHMSHHHLFSSLSCIGSRVAAIVNSSSRSNNDSNNSDSGSDSDTPTVTDLQRQIHQSNPQVSIPSINQNVVIDYANSAVHTTSHHLSSLSFLRSCLLANLIIPHRTLSYIHTSILLIHLHRCS